MTEGNVHVSTSSKTWSVYILDEEHLCVVEAGDTECKVTWTGHMVTPYYPTAASHVLQLPD